MKKIVKMLSVLLLLLAACSNSEPAAPSAPAATQQPAAEPQVAPATAKPQLIEFYAEW